MSNPDEEDYRNFVYIYNLEEHSNLMSFVKLRVFLSFNLLLKLNVM